MLYNVIGCSAQYTVFANGKAVLRPGDRLLHTTIPVCSPPGVLHHPCQDQQAGSRTVFAEGIAVAGGVTRQTGEQ